MDENKENVPPASTSAAGSLLEEVELGVDLALVRQVAEGFLSDKALRVILTEEADASRRKPPRLTISLLNILTNIVSGSLPLRPRDKAFFVPRSEAVHRLLEEATTKRQFAAKARAFRRDLELVRKTASLMLLRQA